MKNYKKNNIFNRHIFSIFLIFTLVFFLMNYIGPDQNNSYKIHLQNNIRNIVEKKVADIEPGTEEIELIKGLKLKFVTSQDIIDELGNKKNKLPFYFDSENNNYVFYDRVKINNKFFPVKIVSEKDCIELSMKKFPKRIIVLVLVLLIGILAIIFIFYSASDSIEANLKNEKYHMMQQMARGLAHEIKNPLNSMNLSLQLLKEKSSGGNNTKYLDIIDSEIIRLNKTVSNFMQFSTEIKIQKKETDISELVERITASFSAETELKKINILVNYSGDKYKLNIDEDIIFQALFNLVKNGIESIEKDGNIGIFVEFNQKKLILKIVDDGPGINQNEIDSVFNYFYTTKNEGTGIGLALTKKFIEVHGGNIIVESKDKRTSFIITLPRKVDD